MVPVLWVPILILDKDKDSWQRNSSGRPTVSTDRNIIEPVKEGGKWRTEKAQWRPLWTFSEMSSTDSGAPVAYLFSTENGPT